jgi:hypothetical protein
MLGGIAMISFLLNVQQTKHMTETQVPTFIITIVESMAWLASLQNLDHIDSLWFSLELNYAIDLLDTLSSS